MTPFQRNFDEATVASFGQEWSQFDQRRLSAEESDQLFRRYFQLFPWAELPPNALGFDLGCGSGRWARHVVNRVGHLHCIDVSPAALAGARRNLAHAANCTFHCVDVDHMTIPDSTMDFGYSLGVLHHVPRTADGIAACVNKLKPGAPLLLYLYYSFENRPRWYRQIWQMSDLLRRLVSRTPWRFRLVFSQVIAGLIYYPIARTALLLEKCGANIRNFPLALYRRLSFYTMRTDALDRFGTPLERRFTRAEIHNMMTAAGLRNITFSEDEPYWCAVGWRR